jgi:hypothetical protein
MARFFIKNSNIKYSSTTLEKSLEFHFITLRFRLYLQAYKNTDYVNFRFV